MKRAILGTTILSNGKGHFGPTDQNYKTGQSEPNIPVVPNRNDLFHLMYQPIFPDFGVEWKAVLDCKAQDTGFHNQNFPVFQYPDFLTWGETSQAVINMGRNVSSGNKHGAKRLER